MEYNIFSYYLCCMCFFRDKYNIIGSHAYSYGKSYNLNKIRIKNKKKYKK